MEDTLELYASASGLFRIAHAQASTSDATGEFKQLVGRTQGFRHRT